MKQLIVPSRNDKAYDLSLIAESLSQLPIQAIDELNWKEFPYKPNASFRIAYDDENIYLRYDIREKYIRAKASENNGQVWLDSCVEFFLSPQCNDEYYNFEFNCIGTKLLGYRWLGDETQHAPSNIMNNIRCVSSLGNQPFDEKVGDFSWHLEVVIPWNSLWKHEVHNPKGKMMKANFYKCGDDLIEPHFLSWNAIKTEHPSFHQPKFFGELIFG